MQINYSAAVEMTNRAFLDEKGLSSVFIITPGGYYDVTLQRFAWAMAVSSSCSSAIDNADPDAIQYVFQRVYFKNTGSSDMIKLGGKYFKLTSGKSYACHPSEWLVIDEHSRGTDMVLERVDVNEYVVSGDIESTFFIS